MSNPLIELTTQDGGRVTIAWDQVASLKWSGDVTIVLMNGGHVFYVKEKYEELISKWRKHKKVIITRPRDKRYGKGRD